MSFDKISLGRNNKRYSHRLRFDVNTTFNFGLVQPKFHLLMDDGDVVSGRFSELLRLAPLPVPTMGNVYEETYTRFVPMVQLCPWYDFIRSKKPYPFSGGNTIIPARVPEISNALLVNLLINCFCDVRTAKLSSAASASGFSGSFQYDYNEDLGEIPDLVDAYYTSNSLGNYFRSKVRFGYDRGITFSNADFILPINSTDLLLFRLSNEGKQLRKIFLGLGYGLNINDNDKLSVLPILAFYKAWFDTYNPSRTFSWAQTECYSLIKFFESDYSRLGCQYANSSEWSSPNSSFVSEFYDFALFLTSVYYSEQLNYVSAHRDNPSNDIAYTFSTISNSAETPNLVVVNPVNSSTKAPLVTNGQLSAVALNLLQRVTRYVNKDSVIGNKINEWLRVHGFGDLSNTIFRDASKCSYHRMRAPISAVFSTSDTASSDGAGEYLGAYAGKSLGELQNQSFKYTAPSSGIFIVLSVVVAESAFSNGTDGSNYCTDSDTMFLDEYDALGYEISSKNQLFPDCGFGWSPSCKFDTNMNDVGFGWIPRYSRLKQKRNIVNGDMSLRGTLASLSSYYLDKIISNVVINERPDSSVDIIVTSVPEASEEWQYFNKYPYLGNYDRIFYNSGTELNKPDDDNFISQTVFDIVLTNRMKPISQSYDTFDESHDNSSINVQQS